MICVVIESPFAGDVERNIEYARACVKDCLSRDEAPFASHLLYTQPGILDDTIREERRLGILAGFRWRSAAEKTVVYTDLGTSAGMHMGIDHARELARTGKHTVEFRTLPGWESASGRHPTV